MFNVILGNLVIICGMGSSDFDCSEFIKKIMCSSVQQVQEIAYSHNQSCTVTLLDESKRTCSAFIKGFCNGGK